MSADMSTEFDHHSPEFAADPLGHYAEMRARCPVARSERYGAFWVVTGYEDVARIARDDTTFSSEHDLDGTGSGRDGILIPPSPVRTIPIEVDPPEFLEYRRILNPYFAPTAVEKLRPRIRELAVDALERVLPTGELDLVMDYANPVPSMITLEFLGLPTEGWEMYAGPAHAVNYTPPGTPEFAEAAAGMQWIFQSLYEAVLDRQQNPRDDMISGVTRAILGGESLSAMDAAQICMLVIAGGVDTTTALLAHAFRYLAQNPDARRSLIDKPELIRSAGEELLRYYTPVQALARTVQVDVEVGGQTLSAGDRVLICWGSANHDESVFPEPDRIKLDRFPNRHTSFGLGAHRCLGSNLARLQFEIMVSELLARIPDYTIVDEETVPYQSIGIVNGYVRMPARFPSRGA